MGAIKEAGAVLVALCAGGVVAGGVFAFIAVVGIVPRLTQKIGAQLHVRVFEEAIIFGGILGGASMLFDYSVPFGNVGLAVLGLLYGVFVGCVVVCLAEVLNVLPILSMRAGIKEGLGMMITAFALGKLSGSLIYFFVPGFGGG